MSKNSFHILIVDDSVNLRTVIRRYMKDLPGVTFSEAGNGEEAEQVLQESVLMDTPVDCIVLDWMMPHMSGFEFLQRIRGTEAFKQKPEVIMLTAETYSDQINAALKYGVNAYITKPFTQKDLCAVIEKIMNARNAQLDDSGSGDSNGGLKDAV